MKRNHEIVTAQALLGEDGEIQAPGWSRQQLQRYDRGSIKAPAWRIKEWDYYLIIHDGRKTGDESFAAAFTLSDDGYVGLQSVSFLSLDESAPYEHTKTELSVFPMGKMHFPYDSSQGDVSYKDKKLSLSYSVTPDERHIRCEYADFYDGKPFNADITLLRHTGDTMVIATPWDKKHAFYYNQKINNMPASGEITVGGKTYRFNSETDFGTLDWGRGVWTYDNTWYWGNGNFYIDGHSVGFNIGYGFGNTSAATENVIFFDGKAHKLDDLTINIPNDNSLYDMDSPRYMEKWTITSGGRFEMTFTPILDRKGKIDFKVIISDQHQVFGRMSGFMALDGGERIEIRDVLCFIEKVHNKY